MGNRAVFSHKIIGKSNWIWSCKVYKLGIRIAKQKTPQDGDTLPKMVEQLRLFFVPASRDGAVREYE